ncbi:unnamed protein product [Sphagnum jensenii]|uniref:Uncharacterized protein n=1 Tax=Sphagnum jensenii TaxID=128206 RepID=A0ABP1ABP5_9BRYO
MEAPQDSMERFLFSCTGVAAGLDLLHPPVPTMQHLSHAQDKRAEVESSGGFSCNSVEAMDRRYSGRSCGEVRAGEMEVEVKK